MPGTQQSSTGICGMDEWGQQVIPQNSLILMLNTLMEIYLSLCYGRIITVNNEAILSSPDSFKELGMIIYLFPLKSSESGSNPF